MQKKTSSSIKPPRGNITGALISDDEARHLSSRLYPLGDQWQEICAELEASGYGAPSLVRRNAIESLAATEEGRARLHAYWREWARERLAGLTGPMSILRGKYPHVSAYRSELMALLRADLAAGKIKSEGPIVSPQIEPSLKRIIERGPDDPGAKWLHEEIKKTAQQAASALHLAERPDFAKQDASERYALLIERYRASLEPAGFTLDSHRRTGLMFRKLTSDKRWAFLLADQSKDDVDTGSLSPSFALTLPKKAVLPSAASLNAVATFSPDDIVPCFRTSCAFAKDSYAQFCLAADSIAFLAKTVYERVDRLLAEP
jgi:hypothetical protein